MSREADVSGCLGYIIGYLIVAAIGGFAAQYLIWVFFVKDIPWYGDALIGFFGGSIVVPAAIVVWLLRLFAVM